MYKIYTYKWDIYLSHIRPLLLTMRLATVILIVSMMQVNASGFAQKLTFKTTNGQLKQLFIEIKRQTGYNVVWNADRIRAAKPITVNFVETDLEQVLKTSLSNQQLTYTIEKKTVVISEQEPVTLFKPFVFAIDVRGNVVDEKGDPLAGANVKHKKTGNTVLTDPLGNFSLKGVDEGDLLEITFLGYKSVEVKAMATTLSIRMVVSTNELNYVEVVSTGFQILSKRQSSGTIEHVGQEVLANRPNTDLSAMLQGIVAGMQGKESANGNIAFTIRGISTLGTANNQRSPLIVIDGFPLMNGDFSAINPNDVESVDVLKDAAASAIWGARSANGVIVVTTKRGKGKQGLSINFSDFTRIAESGNTNKFDPLSPISN